MERSKTSYSDEKCLRDNTAFGLFQDNDAAERAIQQLSAAGFDKKKIGVAVAQSSKTGGFADRLRSMFSPGERDAYAGRDAFDTLEYMCVPPGERASYEDALRSGAILVSVESEGPRRTEAQRIIDQAGGLSADRLKISSSAAQRTGHTSGEEQHRIALIGEALNIHKERVERGAVRLGKDVVTEKQTVQVPVSREEVVINRRSPTNAEQPARTNFGEDQEIRIPVSEERVQVEKRPVVREEVGVGKRKIEDTKQVSADVRHEELKVESEGDVDVPKGGKRRTA
jgi:uncharacterized protein (TIGR02271 family)